MFWRKWTIKGRPALDYMASEEGRHIALGFCGGGGAIVACLLWIPHSFAINFTKKNIQMYKDGYPVKPSAACIELASQVLADCNINLEDAGFIRWFTAFGFDPMTKGQIGFPKGAIIGLPKTFYYTSPEDVDRQLIKMYRDKSIPWKTEAGEALMNSLLLSDDAKKYAMAREVNLANSQYVVTRSLSVGFIVALFSALANRVNDRFGLFRYPLWVRQSLYGAYTAVALTTMVLVFDYCTMYFGDKADAACVDLGQSYVQGGIELYSKHLLRNRALRELLGKPGTKTYDVDGNIRHFVRPHSALSERKKMLEKELKDILENPNRPVPPKPEVIDYPRRITMV